MTEACPGPLTQAMSAPSLPHTSLGLVLKLLVSLALGAEQPWSPIVGGLSFPPLLPASNLIVHSPPSWASLRTVSSDNSLPSHYYLLCFR